MDMIDNFDLMSQITNEIQRETGIGYDSIAGI